jgi:NDP-sugar pyrophosphorylase family protein
MSIPALVLAAGKSTRIATVSGGRPKPLLEVAGRPIIAWNLEWLARNGVRDVWVNLHYRPGEIRAVLGDGSAFGVRIRYSHEDTILGTAGAWRHLGREWSGTSLVVYGDNLLRFDLASFFDCHRQQATLATIALFDPEVHANTRIAGGSVALGTDRRVEEFIEGSIDSGRGGRYVNAGVYVLEPDLLERIATGFQDFGCDVFPGMLAGRELAGHVIEPSGYCLGLDTPTSFRIAESLISTRQVALA